MRCQLCGQKDCCGADMVDKDNLRELVEELEVERRLAVGSGSTVFQWYADGMRYCIGKIKATIGGE